MKDTILQVAKNVIKDPVPVVNTGLILGMTAMEWEVLFTVIVGTTTTVWTVLKIINEFYRAKQNLTETNKEKRDK
jgi:hypothetical protein